MRVLLIMATALMLAGCACPRPAPRADQYQAGYAAAWRAAKAEGRRDALAALRAAPAFQSQPLPTCSHRVSWLPRTPNIDDNTWWQSRDTNIGLLDDCREISARNAAVARARYHALQDAR